MLTENYMINIILSFSVSFILSLFLTPIMMMVARKFGVMDQPSERKVHKEPIPLLGGIAIAAASIISFTLFSNSGDSILLPLLLISTVSVTVMGLIDDKISLSAVRRLIILFIIAVIVIIGSVQMYSDAQNLISRNFRSILIFSMFIVIWIVGVTNAINFTDGLDGLASYISIISTLSFAVIIAYQGRGLVALPIALSLVGAIAGFIPYNRNPAMIFMGDSGSMFIGFMLSLLSISSIRNESTIFAIVVPAYFLFLPMLDMWISILRRLLTGKSIMSPDRLHFHHLLNNRFSNQLIVVIFLSIVQIVFSIIGILVFITKAYLIGWIIICSITLISSIYILFSTIRSKKREIN